MTWWFPAGGGPWLRSPIATPTLVCIPCGIYYGGVARVGAPCATCDGRIVDLAFAIMTHARRFDGASWCAQSIRSGASPR